MSTRARFLNELLQITRSGSVPVFVDALTRLARVAPREALRHWRSGRDGRFCPEYRAQALSELR
jgi:hypothetical protein